MPPADPNDRARRLMVQHAQTAALMGVDFVPLYRVPELSGGPEAPAADAAPAPAAPRDTPATTNPPPPRRAAAAAATAEQPPQPARSTGLFGAEPAAEPKARPNIGIEPVQVRWTRATGRDAKQKALDELRARYEAEAPHQHFGYGFQNIVFGEGDAAARLMFIGEAPGEEEDKTGRPFVGRAGQLLEKMIIAMGLSRQQVYIANVLKTRPPNNATPTTRETILSEPYLLEQVSIIEPEVIVTLGLPASRLLLRSEATMSALRGRWGQLTLDEGRAIAVMPTYHPAFLLRSYTDENRRKVWSDLQLVMERLGLKGKGGAGGMA